jgi:hypothetical protein
MIYTNNNSLLKYIFISQFYSKRIQRIFIIAERIYSNSFTKSLNNYNYEKIFTLTYFHAYHESVVKTN